MFRKANPLCCNPLHLHDGQIRPAQQVHHIVPLERAPERAFDWGNLAPLCTECHGAVEVMERHGADTSGLFRKGDADAE